MRRDRSNFTVPVQLWFLVAVIVMEIRMSRQQQCSPLLPTDQSQPGYALIGCEYKSFPAESYAACALECVIDEKCMSLNFLMTTTTCDLNTQNKKSRPDLFKERHNSIYATSMEPRTPKPMKGIQRLPGKSCLDILVSGDSIGTGVYWIDPANTGSPIKALCDMETDRGGWTIVKKLVLQSPKIISRLLLATYHVIASYDKNDKNVMPTSAALLDIKQKMGFHQIHFYCHKKSTGRVVSIVTKNNTAGQQVLRYFTDDAFAKSNFPVACGSFGRLAEDTSVLAQNCAKWGKDENRKMKIDKWGSHIARGLFRIVTGPIWLEDENIISSFSCDDNVGPLHVNDKWQIAVR